MIYIFSDTHGRHRELNVPKADLMIFGGDESNSSNIAINANEAIDFLEWYDAVPCPTKIFVPGNHSLAIERCLVILKDFPTITPLINEGVEWNSEYIWGSPYTPSFSQYHGSYTRARHKMCNVWDQIPDKTTILVTHGPPQGMLDLAIDINEGGLINVGCNSLTCKVDEIKPNLHVFGHIHDFEHKGKKRKNSGILKHPHTTYVNAVVCDHQYGKTNNGVGVEMGRFFYV